MALGDSVRLRQILTNLLSNAVKFTPAGSVTLSADARVLNDGRASIRLSVRDTGVGIPHEQQGRLFSSFTQGDSSTTRRFGGTGLGLAISKQLVELMGGSIGLESEPGQGTALWFDVPLASATGNTPPPAGIAEMADFSLDPVRC
jgi:signal transduction histidine kinase